MSDETREPGRNPGYELHDTKARPAMLSGLALLGLVLVAFVVAFSVFGSLRQGREKAAVAPSPLAPSRQLPVGPRLQVDPEADLVRFHTRQDSVLNSYGWVQRDAGVVRIPIAEAMQRVLEDGLPARDDYAKWMAEENGNQ